MSNQQTALTTVTPKTMTIKTEQDFNNWLTDRSTEMEAFLTTGRNTSWLQKEVTLAVMASEDLKRNLKTPEGQISFIHSLRYAAAAGLPLNPQLGKACFVPKGGKVLYWPMKEGLIDLVIDTGLVDYIISFTVKANDELKLPSHPKDTYSFTPARKDRGETDGYCAICKLKDDKIFSVYWTATEIEIHKKRYSARTSMSDDGYGEKTVLKQLCQKLHLGSSRLDAALMGEDDGTYGYSESRTAGGGNEKGVSGDDLLKRMGSDAPFVAETEETDKPDKTEKAETKLDDKLKPADKPKPEPVKRKKVQKPVDVEDVEEIPAETQDEPPVDSYADEEPSGMESEDLF